MVETFTMKYLYQDSICLNLSEIRRVEKAIKNYEESKIQHFTLSLFSESLRLGYLNYKSLPATL